MFKKSDSYIQLGMFACCCVVNILMGLTLAHAQIFYNSEVPKYRTFETEIINTKWYVNPFTDVTLKAEFTSPSGKKVEFFGFYDGDGKGGQNGDVWKLRFLPTEVGTYTYTYSWSDSTTGGSGKFRCVSEGMGKGILRPYEKNPRWVAWNGKEPVMIRAWYIGKLTNTELTWSVDHVYQPLLKRRYNMIMYIGSLYGYNNRLLNDAPDTIYPDTGRGFDVNLAGWKQVESHFKWLNEHNMVVHHWVGLGNEREGWKEWSDQEKTFHIRYIMSRLAPMANHTWGYWWEIQAPDDFMKLLDKYDPWDHLRGGQNCKEDISFHQPYYTWMNHSEGSRLYAPDEFHSKALEVWSKVTPKMPLVLNETLMWHSNPKRALITDTKIRRLAWAVSTAGAYFVWNWAGTETTDEWCYASKMFISRADEWLDIIYNTFDSELNMGPLVPADERIVQTSSAPTWSMEGGGQYLVFDQNGGSFSLQMDPGKYNFVWINAVTGEKTFGSVKCKGEPVRFSTPDTSTDWALVLQTKNHE